MNTFFEKLTGSRGRAASEDAQYPEEAEAYAVRAPALTKAEAPRIVRRPSAQKSMHLKVHEHEEKTAVPEEQPLEEEGELTVDIYDEGDAIVIQSTVAGVKPEDLDVSITNDTVTIRGRRERGHEVSDGAYYYKELFWGVFSRQVILPEEVEEDEAEASLKHGLLSIRLPKKRRGVVQKLKVKVT